MTKTALKVDGMTCDHCVSAVTDALEKLAGVTRADVDLEEGRADVMHDDGAPDLEEMQAAVADAGYAARPMV